MLNQQSQDILLHDGSEVFQVLKRATDFRDSRTHVSVLVWFMQMEIHSLAFYLESVHSEQTEGYSYVIKKTK